MSDKTLYLEIVTPSKIIFNGNVKNVTVPGELGSFQILYNHAPIISNLTIGEIKIVDENGNTLHYAVSGGFVMVFKNRITIVSDSLAKPEEIDVNRDQSELMRLKDDLVKKRKTGDVEELEKKIKQLENRIKIANKVK